MSKPFSRAASASLRVIPPTHKTFAFVTFIAAKYSSISPSGVARMPKTPNLPHVSLNKLVEFTTAEAARRTEILLYFIRTYPLTDETAGYISAVLQEWCRMFLADEGVTSGPHCKVIDVGAKKVWPGVKATVQRMKDIEACCQNIADLWPGIKE